MTEDARYHLTIDELQRGLDDILQSPADVGVVRLLVRRPRTNARETLTTARLDCELGLVGDNWHKPGRTQSTEMQLTLMNARVVALLARDESRWPLAGDQVYVDLDLSIENLPVGSLLSMGEAVVEVAAPPHLGCRKFAAWFGDDAVAFVNSARGRQHRLRGLNARIIRSGDVKVGDVVQKLSAP